jgi:hypothetical protein
VQHVQRKQWLTQLCCACSPRLHDDLPLPADNKPKSSDDTGNCCQNDQGKYTSSYAHQTGQNNEACHRPAEAAAARLPLAKLHQRAHSAARPLRRGTRHNYQTSRASPAAAADQAGSSAAAAAAAPPCSRGTRTRSTGIKWPNACCRPRAWLHARGRKACAVPWPCTAGWRVPAREPDDSCLNIPRRPHGGQGSACPSG